MTNHLQIPKKLNELLVITNHLNIPENLILHYIELPTKFVSEFDIMKEHINKIYPDLPRSPDNKEETHIKYVKLRNEYLRNVDQNVGGFREAMHISNIRKFAQRFIKKFNLKQSQEYVPIIKVHNTPI